MTWVLVLNVIKNRHVNSLACNRKRGWDLYWCETRLYLCQWGGVNVITAGVQMKRARECVAVLLSDEWHSAVIDFGCLSSRILWIKFRFSRVKVCVVVRYGSSERNCEERERF